MKPALPADDRRLREIDAARRAVMYEDRPMAGALVGNWPENAWLERSWRRCLEAGRRPEQRVSFDTVSSQAMRRTAEANHALVQAARPALEKLGRAIADTRYFAILTDAQGVVIDVNGAVDHGDRRASLITRIGVDLSERAVGTTAIGAALAELHPVWLHRGEHFFADTSVYSCAGAPLFGPQGQCVGMLDLTGVEVAERPELKHLVAQSARSIENALTLARAHSLVLHINWPGRTLGDEACGLVCADEDGWVTGANQAAREMLSPLAAQGMPAIHCSELFALPYETLFDAARRDTPPMEVPTWSGLRLQVLPCVPGRAVRAGAPARPQALPLREVETELIRKAVEDARGNVMKAARALGISRATVYRRLGRGR